MKFYSLKQCAAALLSALSFISLAQAKDTPAEAVNLKVEVDRTMLPANTDDRVIVKVSLDALRLPEPENRPPVNISLVIDRSGSMSGEKLAHAKEAALLALSRLSTDDIVSVVTYDTEVETIVPAGRVGSGRHIASAIRAISARGNTALFGGVSQGASEVRKHLEDRRYNHRVILVSDGLANEGPSTPEELGRLGSALMKEGISVTTIGLGLGFNEDLMTRLAQRSDGNTYFVESSADLPRIFSAELGDVLNIVARRVVVEVTFPEGVRPKSLIGREGTIRGRQVTLELNQLYGGQEKYALVEVEVERRSPGAKLQIAEARLTYDDALKSRTVSMRAGCNVEYTSNSELVVKSANLTLQSQYAENAMAEAKDRAVMLNDRNQREAAADEIRQKAQELAVMAETYQNRVVLDIASKSVEESKRLRAQGLDNAQRKTYRAENAQTRSQQSSR